MMEIEQGDRVEFVGLNGYAGDWAGRKGMVTAVLDSRIEVRNQTKIPGIVNDTWYAFPAHCRLTHKAHWTEVEK